jgi:protein TonB
MPPAREAARALPAFAALSAALHLLLLVVLHPGAVAVGAVESRSAGESGFVGVRLISTQAAAAPTALEGPASGLAPGKDVQSAPPSKSEHTVPDASAPSRPQGSRAAVPSEALSIDIPTVMSELDSYIPSSLLSTPPLASMPILIETPPVEAAEQGLFGVFSIYIDDAGLVRHVIAEEPVPLPEVEEAVRKAFMDARFSPGQVGRLLVKSRIRIEVGVGSTG